MSGNLFAAGAALISLVLVSGCTSNRVDYGGVMSVAAQPAGAVDCGDAHWQLAETVPPEYPRQLMLFLYFDQARTDTRNLIYVFDINGQGRPQNIRFESPASYLDHRALRWAILSGAESVSRSQYVYAEGGDPVYATDCRSTVSFSATFLMN